MNADRVRPLRAQRIGDHHDRGQTTVVGGTVRHRLQTITGQPVARITVLTGYEHRLRLRVVREIRRRAIHPTAGRAGNPDRTPGWSIRLTRPLPSAGIRGPAGVHLAANGGALTGNGGGGITGPPGGALVIAGSGPRRPRRHPREGQPVGHGDLICGESEDQNGGEQHARRAGPDRSGTRRIIDLGASQRRHLIRSAGDPVIDRRSSPRRVTTIDPLTPWRPLVCGRVNGTKMT